MNPEGNKLNDLKLIRSKKLRLTYFNSSHKILLKGQKKRRQLLLIAALIIVLLGALGLNSPVAKEAFLIYKLRNKNILIGFQNSAELRPTGGFWGSFGILSIDKNLDMNLRFDTNPYKKDNQVFKTSTVTLPKPLRETWPDRNQSFVNANYQINFPETAKSLEWFLNEGWGEKTEGVVAISSLAVIDLLKLTGPVEVDDTSVSSDNFTKVLSDKIDRDYWLSEENLKINEPKTILKDLAPELVKKTKRLGLIKIYRFWQDQIKRGHILAYSNDPNIQKKIERLGFGGEIKSTPLDYLSVNNANLNGGKSSLNVSQTINYELENAVDQPISTVTLSRKQNHDWPGILNRNYTRVFTPLGSKLISASLDGHDITEQIETSVESGRTYFGFWFSVSPGETRQATVKYKLPFAFSSLKNYNLVWQKQPGTLSDQIEIKAFGKLLYSAANDENYLKINP